MSQSCQQHLVTRSKDCRNFRDRLKARVSIHAILLPSVSCSMISKAHRGIFCIPHKPPTHVLGWRGGECTIVSRFDGSCLASSSLLSMRFSMSTRNATGGESNSHCIFLASNMSFASARAKARVFSCPGPVHTGLCAIRVRSDVEPTSMNHVPSASDEMSFQACLSSRSQLPSDTTRDTYGPIAIESQSWS